MTDLAAHLPGWMRRVLALRRSSAPCGTAILLEQVVPLDARRRLCVLRCGDNRLLLLTGGPQDLSLGWLPQSSPQTDPM